jgi:probable rRNA maturation factor
VSSDPDPVVVVVDQQDFVAVQTERWSGLAAKVLISEGVQGPAEMSLRFVDVGEIARLKSEFLEGDGEPTDVLSFPIDGADGPVVRLRLVGDVVICPEIAAANAKQNAGTRIGHDGTYEHEMALLVVHGVLHLLGMDHAESDEATAMKNSEQRHLHAFWGSVR